MKIEKLERDDVQMNDNRMQTQETMLPSLKDRAEILARQNGICFYCGLNLGLGVIYDHFVPRNANGGHGPENRVAACRDCDGCKGGRMPTDEERARLAEQLK